jgi:hypothetical protein
LRADWRQEWEAELRHSTSAFWDALWLTTSMGGRDVSRPALWRADAA